VAAQGITPGLAKALTGAFPARFALARPRRRAYNAAMTGLCFIHRITGPAL